MTITVKNASTAISNLSQSMFLRDEAINTPTIINAGDVTSGVMTLKRGENKIASKNKAAVTTDANPVRPPASTPAVDSRKDVVVDGPTVAARTVAAESDNNARRALR